MKTLTTLYRYPAKDPGRAAIVINMEAHPVIAESLQIIDDAMKAFLEQTGRSATNHNNLVRNDRLTMKYPLLVPQADWSEYNANLKDQGGEFLGNSII